MKRLMAVLLTASLILQAWAGDVVLAQAGSLQEDNVYSQEDSEVKSDVNRADTDIADVPGFSEEAPDVESEEKTADQGPKDETEGTEPQANADEVESLPSTEDVQTQKNIDGKEASEGINVPEERSVLEVEVTSAEHLFYVFCLHVCLYTTPVPVDHENQKRCLVP